MPCGATTASDRPQPAAIANFARNFISGLHHEQRHSLPPGATLLSYLQTAIGQPADAVPHEPWLMRHKRRPALPRQSAAATAAIDLAPAIGRTSCRERVCQYV